jgi:hypothetical protein
VAIALTHSGEGFTKEVVVGIPSRFLADGVKYDVVRFDGCLLSEIPSGITTHSDSIFCFDCSQNGRQPAAARGRLHRQIVIIGDFK